jgi:3-phosphoshikimate 1-carboxyvinyltransferase
MSFVRLSHPTKIIKGSISLPTSKSISNRALILQAIRNRNIRLDNLSEADDTVIMQDALKQTQGEINVKNAGTCMRFLTAYFAAKPGMNVFLTCDPRMELRPMHLLVDALTQVGADIRYLKKEGFPPLQIKGKQLEGGSVQVDASVSSQFISALMMIAPLCIKGLTIELTGTISSQPYIDMTAQMMKQFGFTVEPDYTVIRIPYQPDVPSTDSLNSYTIESDWSAAGYWYEMAALSKEAEVLLTGLKLDSLQGDRGVVDIMEGLGVISEQVSLGVLMKKGDEERAESSGKFLNYKGTKGHKGNTIDLVNMPDLAPALVVTAAGLKRGIVLTGLQNLVIKESNRLLALSTELRKCGFDIVDTPDTLSIIKKSSLSPIPYSLSPISTYGDHRMAMAFAPLALVFPDITIEDTEVVAKSYPRFWDDLQKVGFNLKS